MENIAKTTPDIFRVLFVLDSDDEPSWDAVEEITDERVYALEHDGTMTRKVNAGVKATDEAWMCIVGDDVRFYGGWYEAAMAKAAEGVGVIGTNDLHNPDVQRGDYATQFLVARWYAELGTVDEPGKVLHEGYHHNCSDVELCRTAQARDAYAHAHESVIEHLHPNWGMASMDSTYERGGFANVDADAALYREREKLWTV